ncbi:hypothetical protein [Rubrobacter indicoceani]|uniref:hypothetical protein n=1 Tax=Rubrobacter indicoceani TaxID=2051957 RepID=UPI0013C427E8|nr:hypothetical protein [Rubrobacter indicoceani]
MSLLSKIFGSSPLKLTRNLGAYLLSSGDISPLYVFFDAENTGREAVEVTSVGVRTKGSEEPLRFEIEGEIPARIPAGGNTRYRVRAKELARVARGAGCSGNTKLTFVAVDGAGNKHRHSFRLRVDEYLSLKDE